ncbi:SMP-30/gluconolactonase/LRE family protein [soil metagenome]
MLQTIPSRLLVNAGCELGEGPFWYDDRLWWVDIDRGHLHSVHEDGANQTTDFLGQRIGAAAPIDGNRFIVAMEKGIGFFDRARQTIDPSNLHDTPSPTSRFNDGKCDPVGRFLAGTLCMDGTPGVSALYCFEHPGSIRKILSEVTLSNGLAWSADGRTMYFIDSMSFAVTAFDYDLATASLSKKKTVIQIPEAMGIPDGMDIDTEGNLWIAHWGGSAVRCWSPQTGECLAEIPTPCTQPTSCCFGGPAYNSLYITSARTDLSLFELQRQPLAGSIFVCEPGVAGRPTKTFRAVQTAE